jgi:sugar phosphate isomerase/epimerase
MSSISRREFFQKTAAGAAAMSVVAAQVAKLKANPLGLPIGSQTFPFRARIQAGDLAGLLKDMKAIGIDMVEFCDPIGYVGANSFANIADGKATRKLLDDNGIRAVSCHVDMPVYRSAANFAKTIEWAHQLGLECLSSADLGTRRKDGTIRVTNGITTEDEVKRAAEEYNEIAAVTKKAGMQQILHNEGFVSSRLDDGRLTYPVLLHYFDPDLVKMQFQMSSMATLGDPITYFMNYPGRFLSCHLQAVDATQGMRAMTPGRLPVKGEAPQGRRGEAPAPGAQGGGRPGGAPAGGAAPAAAPGGRAGQGGGGLALGEDTADWPRIFAAAKTGGLKYPFVEQNSMDVVARSVAYLKTLT